MLIMCEQWHEDSGRMDGGLKNAAAAEDSAAMDAKIDREFRDHRRYRLPRANKAQSRKQCPKELKNASLKKIALILQKSASERSFDEVKALDECSEEVKQVQLRWKKRDEAKKRLTEYEDPPHLFKEKCARLAQAIAQAQHLVVYTGAGISTSAKIPDYRGPNGIWTRLQQGKDVGRHDLTLADPTYTHMALNELYKQNILKYVVSQNCDGLHLRSGLPRTVLSELHGNMYLEVCKNCKPHREYLRSFDVTENTSRFFHKTSRKCYACNGALIDTIVHFGERGTLQWPLNWKGACVNANKATTILCLGSSLRVLKKYPWLWQMDKPAKKRPNLYIVNLQWTPKDECANVKINGKCDDVMRSVMECLGIPPSSYDRRKDPLLHHCTRLSEMELHTTTQPFLKEADDENRVGGGGGSDENSVAACDKKLVVVELKNDFDGVAAADTTAPPPHSAEPFRSVFSIDSILGDGGNTCSAAKSPLPNYPHDFFYFRRNEIYKNVSDLYYYSYPHQSSWLYPGLHSIIEPQSKNHRQSVCGTKQQENREGEGVGSSLLLDAKAKTTSEATCEFCHVNLNSSDCLFYRPAEPTFEKKQFRYSKIEKKEKPNICVCCDYSTDEDETTTTETAMTIVQQNNGEKGRVQAGWFGKGYKKGRRKRNW